MKVTITETREIDVDMVFPIYKKTVCHHAVILSENEMILVTDSFCKGIEYRGYVDSSWFTKDDCDASEFFEAHNRMLAMTEDKISKLLLEKAA